MTAPSLAPFLRATEGMDLAALTTAIRALCDQGVGFFTYPPPKGSREWPASTRVELTLFGIWAEGATETETVAEWRKAASRDAVSTMVVTGDVK
jgi:hypothetical protein